jgi:ABC-type nitrate/sulfonate/bicarbonate transport system substrate-binding protein
LKKLVSTGILGLLIAACGGPPAASSSPGSSAATSTRAASAASVAASVSAAAPASANPTPVKLADNKSAVVSGFGWITYEQGIFSKHGLNVEMQGVDPSIGSKLLGAGQIEAGILPSAQVVNIKASGAPITVVAVAQVSNQWLLVQNNIDSVEQLKGKIVGVTSRQAANSGVLIRALRSHGMEVDKDYQILQSGEAGGYQGLAAQLVAHNVDAAAMDPQFAPPVLALGGYKNLMDLAQQGFSAAGLTLAVTNDFMAKNPAAVQGLVDSIIEGIHFAQDHKAEVQDVFKKDYSITEQSQLDFNYDFVLRTWIHNPEPKKDAFPDIIDVLSKDNPAVASVNLDTFLEPKYVQDAAKRGLTNF